MRHAGCSFTTLSGIFFFLPFFGFLDDAMNSTKPTTHPLQFLRSPAYQPDPFSAIWLYPTNPKLRFQNQSCHSFRRSLDFVYSNGLVLSCCVFSLLHLRLPPFLYLIPLSSLFFCDSFTFLSIPGRFPSRRMEWRLLFFGLYYFFFQLTHLASLFLLPLGSLKWYGTGGSRAICASRAHVRLEK
ncbi:hypothetical protein B0I35DRAFT_204126 [Stachybotrys elegans]|uniref:Uncharacterized protein n=1 Tax=Stachybotrys elegans TaxID=80388 RepID=A0A8K0SZE4_9HYPO|nr:hypothetical protein B0I35DRAFT_204126 [Stachybotrys elegans]